MQKDVTQSQKDLKKIFKWLIFYNHVHECPITCLWFHVMLNSFEYTTENNFEYFKNVFQDHIYFDSVYELLKLKHKIYIKKIINCESCLFISFRWNINCNGIDKY